MAYDGLPVDDPLRRLLQAELDQTWTASLSRGPPEVPGPVTDAGAFLEPRKG